MDNVYPLLPSLVLAPLEHAALAQQGLPLELWRNAEGLSAAEQSVIDANGRASASTWACQPRSTMGQSAS